MICWDHEELHKIRGPLSTFLDWFTSKTLLVLFDLNESIWNGLVNQMILSTYTLIILDITIVFYVI